MQIHRTTELIKLKQRLQQSPCVALLGPRQCGKTTLARQLASSEDQNKTHWFDLENPRDLARLENPMLTMESLRGLVVLDEIQLRPDLFSTLRVLIDQKESVKFLILGSASRDLIAQSSQTLAGRISYLEMSGFNLGHFSKDVVHKLWVRGGFPRSFLAASEADSFQWRRDFVSTFLERDIPRLGIQIPPETLRRFWTMLSHYHGQIFEASQIGRSLSVEDTTARRYLDILCGTFLIRQLQPWFYNTKKRLVKRPKIYFRDSGLLHFLMGLENEESLSQHPRLGASWEGFALEQAIELLGIAQEDLFFWAVHAGGELDLVCRAHGKLWGIEAKYQDAPKMSASMQSALKELNLEHIWVLYPGEKDYALHDRVSVLGLKNLSQKKWKLG